MKQYADTAYTPPRTLKRLDIAAAIALGLAFSVLVYFGV